MPQEDKILNASGMMEPHLTKEFAETFWWRKRVEEKKLEPIKSLCFWFDIHGFGKALAGSNWELEKLQEAGLIKLLSDVYMAGFPTLIQDPPQPSEHVLAINDGIAKTIDALDADSYPDPKLLMYYLRDNLCVHYRLVTSMRDAGYGFRSVFAGGERMQYAPVKITGQSFLHYNPAYADESAKNFLNQELIIYPAEFQMNTAFSRAFIIESKGSDFGIKKDRMYIEERFFEVLRKVLGKYIQISDNGADKIQFFADETLLFDISYDKVIDFKAQNLACKVFQLSAFVVHKGLERETTEFPLLPDIIEEIMSKKWALTENGVKEAT